MKTLALVDADVLVYQVSAANSNAGGTLEELHFLLQATVDGWVEDCGADEYRLYATFGPTFRHHFYPPYKQNRVGKPKPCGLREARAWLRAHESCVYESGYEADDLIAMAASADSEEHCKIIVSTDKDYWQVMGAHMWNPRTREHLNENPLEMTPDIFRLFQWMCGDDGDGYKGINRYGIKTFQKDIAELEFDGWSDMEQWGRDKYKEKGYTDQYTTQMLVCATILTSRLTPREHRFVRQLVGEMTPKQSVA